MANHLRFLCKGLIIPKAHWFEAFCSHLSKDDHQIKTEAALSCYFSRRVNPTS